MGTNVQIEEGKVCRVCMVEYEEMRSLLYDCDARKRSLADVLTFVTNIVVKESDNLPKQICSGCEVLMLQSSSFKRRCLETEYQLKSRLNCLPSQEIFDGMPVIKTEGCSENLEFLFQPYQCSICFTKFDNTDDLSKHVISSHNKQDKLNVDEKQTTVDEKFIVNISNNNCGYKVKDNPENIKEEIIDGNDVSDELFSDDFVDDMLITFNADDAKCDVKNIVVLTCVTCNAEFDNKLKLIDHIQKSHTAIDKKVTKQAKETKHSCSPCDLQFESTKSYRAHKRLLHSQKHSSREARHECSHCMRKFVKKITLIAHLKTHELPSMNHICNICKREFKHRAHLDNHLLSLHSTNNDFKCLLCSKSFPTQDDLNMHKDTHKTKKRHQCKYCSKAFNMLSTLRDHLRVHTGEKPFLCPTCGKGFTQNTNLMEHLRRHQGIKPFKCEMCDRRFVSKGELSAHSRKHSGAHPFVCDECGNGFTTSSSLVKHRRTHTGERPYACDLCPMKFAASGTLKNHRRTHTGEKPYKCSHCEKAFVQKNDLVAHTRCHTGERPYVCPTCGQAFRQGSALKTHLKMHTIKENQPLLHSMKKDGLMQDIGIQSMSSNDSV